MPSISYAVTVCNEIKEIKELIPFLTNHMRNEDELIVLLDLENLSPEVRDYLELTSVELAVNGTDFHRIFGSLKKDFAGFKNFLKEHCTKDYVFFIDADELPSEHLINLLPQILEHNDVDVIRVPRVNTVDGLTEHDILKWGWRVNEQGWVNWPDFQDRICKNLKNIIWEGKVHEKLVGYEKIANLPSDYSDYALFHKKEIERQRKQNEFYSNI